MLLNFMHYTFTAKFSSILHDSIQLRHFGTTVSLKRIQSVENGIEGGRIQQ